MEKETLVEIVQRITAGLLEKSSFSETIVGGSEDMLLDEIYSEHFGKFSEDFGSFGIEIDKIRSTVLPISTIKSVTKSIESLEGTQLKGNDENKESTKIKFEEHLVEPYENAFLRMMGMPNEKNFLGKELSSISDGKFEKFIEGETKSIYSIFSKRDSASTDRIASPRSEALVFLTANQRDMSYFSKKDAAEIQKVIESTKKEKENKESNLKDNESIDVEKLRVSFFKSLSLEPGFSNYLDTTSSEISFGTVADSTLTRIFKSEVMGEKIPQKNLLNYADFILEEASLLFPPIQDSRIEYCLSESDKIISKPFDIGDLTINRSEVGRSLLESVIRIRMDSVMGIKDGPSEELDPIGIIIAEDAGSTSVGNSSSEKNSEAFSLIEKIIIDRLYLSLINLSDAFFELTQNYYKVCRKARKTLSEVISVEDHNKVKDYSESGSASTDIGEEEKTMRLLYNIDKTIMLLLEKNKTSTREFGSYRTTSVYDGAAMNTLLKVITIPSVYAEKKLEKYKTATEILANGSNGVLDTSVKLSHIAGLKRGVGIVDLICFGITFFTIDIRDLLGLLDEKQINRMKKELSIRGGVGKINSTRRDDEILGKTNGELRSFFKFIEVIGKITSIIIALLLRERGAMSFDLKIQNGDLSIGPDGDVSFVIGNEKVLQEIKKIILTDIGENKFHPFYGSRAGSLSVGNIVDYNFLSSEIKRSVSEAITNLIRLKSQQSRYQALNPSEVIISLDSVSVERDLVDPRVWSIFISVTVQSLDEINTVINIRM